MGEARRGSRKPRKRSDFVLFFLFYFRFVFVAIEFSIELDDSTLELFVGRFGIDGIFFFWRTAIGR